METIINFLRTDAMLIALVVLVIILAVLYIINTVKLSKINKSYSQFMKKLGKDTNIEQDLRNYLQKVENVDIQNRELLEYLNNVNKNMQNCIQKVGIVRYRAFNDVGSDLSFALALLDNYNNGVVLNGIYSADMSNIYAKAVVDGKSTYTLSDEEKQAIEKAIN